MDCHLLALKQIAIEHGFGVPDLFLDESYQISNRFSLSTSQVRKKKCIRIICLCFNILLLLHFCSRFQPQWKVHLCAMVRLCQMATDARTIQNRITFYLLFRHLSHVQRQTLNYSLNRWRKA